MKKNRGITMVALVITIVVLLIIAGISIGAGNNAIKNSKLENLKTNMLLIEVKAKEQIENAKFILKHLEDKYKFMFKNLFWTLIYIIFANWYKVW